MLLPRRYLLWGWEAVLDSLVWCFCSCGHLASGVLELWVQPWWETWGWSGHRSSAGVCWRSSSMSVLLCWFTPAEALIPGVYRQSCKENLWFRYVGTAFLYCHPPPAIPPSLLPSSTFSCAPPDLSYWSQNLCFQQHFSKALSHLGPKKKIRAIHKCYVCAINRKVCPSARTHGEGSIISETLSWFFWAGRDR